MITRLNTRLNEGSAPGGGGVENTGITASTIRLQATAPAQMRHPRQRRIVATPALPKINATTTQTPTGSRKPYGAMPGPSASANSRWKYLLVAILAAQSAENAAGSTSNTPATVTAIVLRGGGILSDS